MFNDLVTMSNDFANMIWESTEDNLLRSIKMATNYPPYNLKKIEDNKYLIEMGVAGFSLGDLEITIDKNILSVSGHKTSEENNTDQKWLHRSLATRDFMRKFAIDRNYQIKNAELVNGVLKIWLDFLSTKDVKKIPIVDGDKKTENKIPFKTTKQLLQENS